MGRRTETKVNHMFSLMEKLARGQELYAQDTNLQESLFGESGEEKHERAIRRYLQDIYELFRHIVITEKKPKELQDRKVTVYRVVRKEDVSTVLKVFLEDYRNLTWVLQTLHEEDPSILKELEGSTVEAIESTLKRDKSTFFFRSRPFEVFTEEKYKTIFLNLKKAIQNHEYRTIYRKGEKLEPVRDAKCLKLIYSENNWYVAVETENSELRLIRVAFIEKVDYGSKITYSKKVLEKYSDYFKGFENPMTLANRRKKKAKFRAHRKISKYFEQDMKPYFRSQKYIGSNEDGSIDFSIEFTQPMELLPFIKRWLPDIEVLEPESLRAELRNELIKSLKRL